MRTHATGDLPAQISASGPTLSPELKHFVVNCTLPRPAGLAAGLSPHFGTSLNLQKGEGAACG